MAISVGIAKKRVAVAAQIATAIDKRAGIGRLPLTRTDDSLSGVSHQISIVAGSCRIRLGVGDAMARQIMVELTGWRRQGFAMWARFVEASQKCQKAGPPGLNKKHSFVTFS